MDNMRLSIKTKLILFALCISLIPIAVITTVYYLTARKVIRRQTFNDLSAIAEMKKRHILSFMDAKKDRAIDFSSDGLIKNNLETINKEGAISDVAVRTLSRHLMVHKKPLDRSIVAVAVVDTKGKVVAASDERFIGMNMSGHESLTLDVSKGTGEAGVSVSQPYFCRFYKTNCVSINAPITSAKTRGKPLGVIILCYDLDVLNQITTNRTGMGATGEVYLVNRDKTMLTDSRFIANTSLRQPVDTEPVRKILEDGREMTGIYADYRGIPVAGASAYIPEYGWILLAEIDEAEAFASLTLLSIVALAVGIICAATVTSVGIVFAFSTARPIYVLKEATEKFKAGDLKYRIKTTREDELGELANSFNNMAGKLALETHKLTCAVEQSPCAVIITDVSGAIEYVNPRFVELTSYTFLDVLGRTPNILKSGTTPPEEYDRLWGVITSGKEWRGEFYNKNKNGDYYWVSAVIAPVKDSSGVITNFVGIQEDITERKRTEERLKRSVEQSDRNVRELKRLMYFSTIMNEEVQEGNLITHMTRILKDNFHPDALSVMMLDREKNVLDVPVVIPSGPVKNFIKEEVVLDPLLCRVIRTGQVFIARDVKKDPFCESAIFTPNEGGCVCLPLVAGGDIAGVIHLSKTDMNAWDEDTIRLLSTYTGLAGSALHRIRLMNSARWASITDALTGAYNRRFFDEMMKKQMALAKRHHEPMSLIIADIDYFKKLNDAHGHAIGDCALQQVTGVIKSSIRSSDILARYGGEEFVIIMPATNLADALEKAESVRQHVEAINFDVKTTQEQSVRLTISLGVASFPEHGTEPGVLVKAADSALYKAKKGGRNRVERP